jgi:tRNA(Ile)-lysidine synthase
MRLDADVLERAPDLVVSRETQRVVFDADHIPTTLVVRARRPGDRFVAFGDSAERRLKSCLIDAGIPRWERLRIPVLEADGEIIWVAGVRRGWTAPVGPSTRRILEVTLRSL